MNVRRLLFFTIGQLNYLRRLQWPAIRQLLDIRQEGMTVLDVGAGGMQYSIALGRCGRVRVVALDVDLKTDFVDRGKQRGLLPVKASGQAIPLGNGSVDRIMMSSVLHMVEHPELLLSECIRVLKPGGHMVISVPNHYQFIPSFINSGFGQALGRFFGLPGSYDDLILSLNARFGVKGSRGYYSFPELNVLLGGSGLCITKHILSPGLVGSLLWELSVLGYVRFGRLSFILVFLAYPFARLCDLFIPMNRGSEHIVKASCNSKLPLWRVNAEETAGSPAVDLNVKELPI